MGRPKRRGRGRAAGGGGVPGERAALRCPGGSGEAKGEPRNGAEEDWAWRLQVKAMKVAPPPRCPCPSLLGPCDKGRAAHPARRGGFGSGSPTPVAQADFIPAWPRWGIPSSLPCQGLCQALPTYPWELGQGGAVLGEPESMGKKPEGGDRGIVAGTEGGILATLGFVGGKGKSPQNY